MSMFIVNRDNLEECILGLISTWNQCFPEQPYSLSSSKSGIPCLITPMGNTPHRSFIFDQNVFVEQRAPNPVVELGIGNPELEESIALPEVPIISSVPAETSASGLVMQVRKEIPPSNSTLAIRSDSDNPTKIVPQISTNDHVVTPVAVPIVIDDGLFDWNLFYQTMNAEMAIDPSSYAPDRSPSELVMDPTIQQVAASIASSSVRIGYFDSKISISPNIREAIGRDLFLRFWEQRGDKSIILEQENLWYGFSLERFNRETGFDLSFDLFVSMIDVLANENKLFVSMLKNSDSGYVWLRDALLSQSFQYYPIDDHMIKTITEEMASYGLPRISDMYSGSSPWLNYGKLLSSPGYRLFFDQTPISLIDHPLVRSISNLVFVSRYELNGTRLTACLPANVHTALEYNLLVRFLDHNCHFGSQYKIRSIVLRDRFSDETGANYFTFAAFQKLLNGIKSIDARYENINRIDRENYSGLTLKSSISQAPNQSFTSTTFLTR